LIVPVAWLAYKGFKKGLVIEIFSLLALLAGIYGGIHFSDFTTHVLTDDFKFTSEYMPVISFAVTFILIVVLVYYVGKLLEKVIKMMALGIVNKISGSLFGILKALLILSLLLVLVDAIDHRASFLPREQVNNSLMYKPIKGLCAQIFPMIEDSEIYDRFQDLRNEHSLEEFDNIDI
jgi:membrane protein required for colicin V production